jgi:hypothetical protein
MTSRNVLWVTFGTAAVALGALVGGFVRTGRAAANPEETVTCSAHFPLISMAKGESAFVHASWVEGEGDPITVKVQFIGRAGELVVERVNALAPNETVSPGMALIPQPQQVRAAVLLEPASGGPGFPSETGCPQVIVGLERFDKSGGVTTVVAPSLPIGSILTRPSPPPDMPPPSDVQPPTDMPPPSDVQPPTDVPPPPPDMPPPPPPDMPPPPPDVG